MYVSPKIILLFNTGKVEVPLRNNTGIQDPTKVYRISFS